MISRVLSSSIRRTALAPVAFCALLGASAPRATTYALLPETTFATGCFDPCLCPILLARPHAATRARPRGRQGRLQHFDSGVVVGGSPALDVRISVNRAFCYDTVIEVVAKPLAKTP